MANRLEATINAAWDRRHELGQDRADDVRTAVASALALLDSGQARVAEPTASGWTVNEWLKKAVLLHFVLSDLRTIDGGPGGSRWWDKVPPKFSGWGEDQFIQAGLRAVPSAVVRYSAYVAPGVVLMPCFVNVGAHVGRGTMVDTWATVGSCAQVGEHCHISGGVGIAGVLEPLQEQPVIVEDGCFIGARSEIAEGVLVGRGSVISMGVYIGASTKIVVRETGEILRGHVPPYSVVVPGTLGGGRQDDGTQLPGLYCAVIIKQVDEGTRAKTSINELLRD
jgi:2,3,4,5-tetrahydropyridine-2-carboxylate N-succinyltransferase